MSFAFPQPSPRMTRIVQALAVRSPLDLAVKFGALTAVMFALTMTLETVMMPPEKQQTIWELGPLLFIGIVVFNGSLLAIVTHQDLLRASLEYAANVDHLTGLPNRRSFMSQLEHHRENGILGFLLIADADHFKRINDTFGHAVGDLCLEAIAARLRDTQGPGDFAGRMGGEEFAIFIHGQSGRRLDDVEQALTQPIQITVLDMDRPVTIDVTLSIGATRTAISLPIEKQLHQADLALYRAKNAGRAQLQKWTPALQLTA